MKKKYRDIDVFTAAVQRIEAIFENFERYMYHFQAVKIRAALFIWLWKWREEKKGFRLMCCT